MFDNLTEGNFVLYTIKNYNSPHYLQSEYQGDIKKVKYIKRLFKKYKVDNDLRERLILNHIILLNNVFSPYPTAKILFFRIDEEYHNILKTFLEYLNIMPEVIFGINGKTIYSKDILLESNIEKILSQL